tara:strand:+ start:4507 stop:4806 length:300 start_codon:yes stop_codon:yes gene_type:complete
MAQDKTLGLKINTNITVNGEVTTHPFRTNSYAITTGKGAVKWAKMAITGKGSLPVPISNSSVQIEASGPYKEFFDQLKLNPEFWSYVTDMSFVLTKVLI